MVCLETSFLVDVLRGYEPARDVMDSVETAAGRPTVPPVVAAEVWVGAYLGTSEEQAETAVLLESLTWLPFTRGAAHRAGELRAELSETGEPIGITDAMIAGIAIDHDETLVTRDDHFQRIPNLRLRTYD